MLDYASKTAKARQFVVGRVILVFNVVSKQHKLLASEAIAATRRVVDATNQAKMPADVLESVVREHETLAGLTFDAARSQLRSTAAQARIQYASLVQTKAMTGSFIESTYLDKILGKLEQRALRTVDKVHDIHLKLVDPLRLSVKPKATR